MRFLGQVRARAPAGMAWVWVVFLVLLWGAEAEAEAEAEAGVRVWVRAWVALWVWGQIGCGRIG